MRTRQLPRLIVAALAAALLLLGAAGSASARPVHFLGPHPIAARLGGGFCYIETPHMHAYAPDHAPLYQEVGGQMVFTGDPTPFGYEGEKHTFYGHHPVITVEGGEPVYCYLDGPHFHPFAPPPTPEYKVQGGVAFYVGPFAPTYAKLKPHRVRQVNAEYRPYVDLRPTVEVQPPPEWHGEVYVSTPSVSVRAPGVYVDAPRPRASVELYAPAPEVVVEPPAPRVVVGAPAPHIYVGAPAPHVYVGAPAPPHVIVGAPAPHVYVGAPAPVVVAPAPHVYVGAPGPGVVVVGGKVHHDNGRHEGWKKH